MELNELRNEINIIDDEIASLFQKRMDAVAKIAEFKKEHNVPVRAGSREREILYRVTDITRKDLEEYTKVLFNTIFDLSRNYQHTKIIDRTSPLREKIEKAAESTANAFPTKAIVACQGVEGANSQIACTKLFSIPQIMYFNNFEGVFQAVENGMCQYGILPIENSSAGSVTQVYDLMVKYKFYIVKSLKLKIEHCLMAKPDAKLSNIKEVVSHEQALNQCSEFLKNHPEIKVTIMENTAKAAKFVSESDRNDIAAIASANCAELYGLSVIESDIMNTDHNYTRFICISKNLEIYPDSNKITFMVSLSHEPGSLYSLLSKFSTNGLNICKIESRPINGKDFEFRFYFDVDTNVRSEDTLKILSQLEDNEFFVFLGNYNEQF